MDKEEYRIKLEQINHLVEAKDYKGAMEVVDSIDWRRVKNVRTLSVVGEIYAANKKYEDARDIFLLAYHRSSIGKNILVRLFEMSLKLNEIDEAEEYYQEFKSVAPNDSTAYVLEYTILKARKADIKKQIAVLETYKNKEFTEKWSFELARLYYENGDRDKAIALCNEMILWFSEGKYVIKAMDLKLKMGAMTDSEREEYEKRFIPKLHKVGEVKKEEETEKSESDQPESDPADAPEEKKEEETDSEETEKEAEESSAEISDEISEEETDRKEISKENSEESSLEEEEDDDLTYESYEAAEDDSDDEESETSGIGRIRVKNDRELEEAETFQERITKGLRDLFGVRRREAQAENEEDEEDEIDSYEYEEDEEESSSKKEQQIRIEEVPELEKEGEEKKTSGTTFSGTMTMPELKIPRSMRRRILEEEEKKEEIPEEQKSASFDSGFNLEDAILAAATAQGIDIPDEEGKVTKSGEEDPEKSENIEEPAEKKAETDLLSEIKAEAESDPDVDLSHVPDLEVPDFDQASEDEGSEKSEEITEMTETEEAVKDSEQEDSEKEESEKDYSEASEKEAADSDATDLVEEEKPARVITQDEFVTSILEWEEVQGSKYKKTGTQVFRRVKDEETNKVILVEDEKKVKKESEKEPVKEIVKQEPPKKKLTEEEEIERFIDSIQPEEDREPEDIVPRSEQLTEEEIKLFSYFTKVPGMQNQIVDTLIDVQEESSDKTSRSGNIIVMGGPESGKTRLISSLIPAICKELNLQASKVAYVFAEQINGKDMDQIFRKLAGGFLVIEKANHLDQETVEKLNTAMERNTGGMIIILEDDKIGMRKFVARYPKLARKFTSTINIPVFTSDELANFARVYAMENGYRIDNMGMLALYNLIGMNQKEDMPMNIGTVKNMVDAAISKSQGGFFKKNSRKKMDRDGFVVLHEKDFNIK